jgi:Tol biopolymer transport system component
MIRSILRYGMRPLQGGALGGSGFCDWSFLSRFTFDAADEIFPVWSPDGARIAFSSNRRTGQQNLYLKPTGGGETEELILESGQPKFATDWSPNGHFLLYFSAEQKTGFDIWALAVDGDRKPFPVVQTNFDERLAQFSPDGNWIAYESNESGRVEIYVQPFAGLENKVGAKLPISNNGGAQVSWRHDGRNCSISRWMGGSCRFRSALLQTVMLWNRAYPCRCSTRI